MEKLNNIKGILEKQGRSQTWLSEKLGKSKNAINAICNNISQPSLSTLYEVAQILEVDICDLLVRENENK